ncbi:hypothetical protein Ddye_001604 [Dipteronia dyeriana]|uniref:Uncharacterized protein n=1 Tax=Dipteronia dyeriana TaxID=168575 RepID=A0AAD9XP73_9ROSI|nr:hypothetical protein Ddye_001604 [Dipteronia dyeriana]
MSKAGNTISNSSQKKIDFGGEGGGGFIELISSLITALDETKKGVVRIIILSKELHCRKGVGFNNNSFDTSVPGHSEPFKDAP